MAEGALTGPARRSGALALGLLAVMAAAFLIAPAREPWDLKLYMACSETLAAGESPYAREQVLGGVSFPCLYPPLALELYRPFAAAERARPGAGVGLWNALKLAAFAALLLLWRRFLGPGFDAGRLAFAALAFGSPFVADFRSGNAGSFEHLLLWSAFAAYAGGRFALFAGLVALAAQAKIQPAAFLGLLLLERKPRWRELAGGAAAALLLFGLNEALHPGRLAEFWRQLSDPAQAWRFERGPNNCSSWGFLQHMLEIGLQDRPLASAWATRLWAPWALLVGALTWRAARRAADGGEAGRRRLVLLAACAFALAAPRFKDYAYFLLIPSALAALEAPAPWLWRAPLLVFALLNSTKAAAERVGLGAWAPAAGYFKLYAALLAFGILSINAGFLDGKAIKSSHR